MLNVAHLAIASVLIHCLAVLVVDGFESAGTSELLWQGQTLLLTRKVLWPKFLKKIAKMMEGVHDLALPKFGMILLIVRKGSKLADVWNAMFIQPSKKHTNPLRRIEAFLSTPPRPMTRRCSFPAELLNGRPLTLNDSRLTQTRTIVSDVEQHTPPNTSMSTSTSTNTRTNSSISSASDVSDASDASDESPVDTILPSSLSPPSTPTTPTLTPEQNADLLEIAIQHDFLSPSDNELIEHVSKLREQSESTTDDGSGSTTGTKVRTLVDGIEARNSNSSTPSPVDAAPGSRSRSSSHSPGQHKRVQQVAMMIDDEKVTGMGRDRGKEKEKEKTVGKARWRPAGGRVAT